MYTVCSQYHCGLPVSMAQFTWHLKPLNFAVHFINSHTVPHNHFETGNVERHHFKNHMIQTFFKFHIRQILSCLYLHVLQCSVSCGKGKRARYVSCRDAQGGVADESHCAHLPRPPESSACFSPCGQWRAGEWSPVSKTSNTVSNQYRCFPLWRQ